jgi:c-di-AMP phosphodiesterase-like protein
MQTYYFRGNYTLGLGLPYVILSIDEDESDYISEKCIIFEGFNHLVKRKFSRIKYPKFSDISLESFRLEEFENCKAEINSILVDNYEPQLKLINYNYRIELVKSDSSIIITLIKKFKEDMAHLKAKTINSDLRLLIDKYKSIDILREEF